MKYSRIDHCSLPTSYLVPHTWILWWCHHSRIMNCGLDHITYVMSQVNFEIVMLPWIILPMGLLGISKILGFHVLSLTFHKTMMSDISWLNFGKEGEIDRTRLSPQWQKLNFDSLKIVWVMVWGELLRDVIVKKKWR